MPKGCKKNTRISDFNLSDVKLSDFANSSPRAGKLRKSVYTSLSKADDILKTDETVWYERDLEEFDFLTITENKKRRSQSKNSPVKSCDGPSTPYPIDLWFLIGQYIYPEDVKKFASICKDSYFVSRSFTFWIRMYKRFYQPDVVLPPRLQPHCILQTFSLKPCVIRALYQMYPHFTEQLAKATSDSDVHHLSNLCCTLTWRSQSNGKWWFYFKFLNMADASCSKPLTYSFAIKQLWASGEDHEGREDLINNNPDEGCKVLRFSCSHFVAVPPAVMGRRLSDVRITLARDMRGQRLQLTFCQGNYRKNRVSESYPEVVEFDAVENLMVLNWWHPQYPSEYKI